MKKQIKKDLDIDLPQYYYDFLMGSKELEIESEYNYIDLWSLERLFQFNKDCESQKYIPNYIIIGTDGGGGAIAMHKNTYKIYYTEMIGMSEEDIWLIAESFNDYMDRFNSEEITF